MPVESTQYMYNNINACKSKAVQKQEEANEKKKKKKNEIKYGYGMRMLCSQLPTAVSISL